MMKKRLLLILAMTMVLSGVACGNTSVQDKDVVNEETTNKQTEIKADSLDALEEMVEKEVEDTIASLAESYEDLQAEIDTYDKYKANTEKVEAFYADVVETQQSLTIRLREYALSYAEMIVDSDSDDKYDELEEIYDVVYDDAAEEVYDEIYKGILEDMYDLYYNGILKDAYNTVEYSEWSDLRSDEYDWWSDSRSDAYDDWSDVRSDIYGFYSDMRGEMWADDMERAQEKIEDFRADIEELKNKLFPSTAYESEKTSDSNEKVKRSEISYDKNNLDSILAALEAKYETAMQSIADESENVFEKIGDTYECYVANKEAVTDFYENSLSVAEELYTDIEAISIDYFNCIASNGIEDYSEWNDSMDEFYDTWNDGMDEFYDTWDDIYEDLYDEADELIEDGASYREYSDIWSEMYEEYSDAWSEMYEEYSDAWSSIYEDYTNVWSGFYNDNTNVQELLGKAMEETASKKETTADDESEADSAELVDGMRPEFKEAMDSYEAFYDEYCDLLKKYKENPTDTSLLSEYADMMQTLVDMDEKFKAWEDNDLNSEELKYYIEVSSRISKKLLDTAS